MGRVFGWRGIGVDVGGPPDVLTAVAGQLPPFFGDDLTPLCSTTVTRADGMLSMELPDDLGYRGPDGPETTRAFASRIELYLADKLTDYAVVHAGVVAFDDRAVLLPGTSMAGKSTLVQALLELGGEYLSDEFALLTPDGLVSAYPRRMTIRTATGSVRVVPPAARAVDAPPIPVGVIAGLRYSAGEPPSIEPLSAAQAVLLLVENAVNARRQPDMALAALSAATRGAACLRGIRGAAAETATALERVMVVGVAGFGDAVRPAR